MDARAGFYALSRDFFESPPESGSHGHLWVPPFLMLDGQMTLAGGRRRALDQFPWQRGSLFPPWVAHREAGACIEFGRLYQLCSKRAEMILSGSGRALPHASLKSVGLATSLAIHRFWAFHIRRSATFLSDLRATKEEVFQVQIDMLSQALRSARLGASPSSTPPPRRSTGLQLECVRAAGRGAGASVGHGDRSHTERAEGGCRAIDLRPTR